MSAAVVVLGLVLLALAIGLAAGAWLLHRRRRLLLDTPTSPAGALQQGRVEVKGTAVPAPGGKMLRAPFSGAPCVHWRYEIEERRTSTTHHTVNGKTQARTTHHWATIAQGASPEPFGVRDLTGVAVVDPRGADVPAKSARTYRSGLFQDPPPEVLSVLQAQGVSHEGWFGINKTMRYVERALPEGTTLYVLGTAAPGPDGRLVVRKADGEPFVISARSEESLLLAYGAGMVACALGALLLLGAGAWLLLRAA